MINFSFDWLGWWSDGMVRASLQGGVAILAVWSVCRLVPAVTPATRCWLWRLALVKLLVAFFWATPIDLPLLPRGAGRTHIVLAQPSRFAPTPTASTGAVGSAASAPAKPATIPATAWLIAAWALGVGLGSLGLIGSARATRRLCRTASPVGDPAAKRILRDLAQRAGLRMVPELLVAEEARGPLVAGGLRPAILCPSWMMSDPDRLRMILAHEGAHIRRKDLLWMWAPALAGTLFYFHPLVWLARREVLLDLESACDAEAVLATEARSDCYAEALVQVVLSGKAWPRVGVAALSAADSAELLKRRLRAMRTIRRASTRARIGAAALVVVAGLAMLPCRLVSGAPDQSALGELPATPSAEVTRLLERAKEKLKATSLTADLEVQYGAGSLITWHASLLKPGYARMELVQPNGGPGQVLLSDGEQYFHIDPAAHEYDAAPNTRRELRPVSSPLLEPFLTGSAPLVGPRMRYAGKQKVDGLEYEVVEYSFGPGTGGGRVFFAKDGLPTGWEQWAEGRAAESVSREWLRNLHPDAGLKPAAFKFDPAAQGYRRVELPVIPPEPR